MEESAAPAAKTQFEVVLCVVEARDLLAADASTSSSDPYCVIPAMNGRTTAVQKNLSPVWKHAFPPKTMDALPDYFVANVFVSVCAWTQAVCPRESY